jgi:hypothetical protein
LRDFVLAGAALLRVLPSTSPIKHDKCHMPK